MEKKEKIQGAYLGQESPGLVPILFAPEIIPMEPILHCYPTITFDGKEIFWTTLEKESPLKIMHMKEDAGSWTPSQPASFSGVYKDQCPLLSQDDQRIYFSSVRPEDAGTSNLWFAEREGNEWSEPQLFSFPPNSNLGVTQQSFADNKTIYFAGRFENAKYGVGIYYSRFLNGMYTEPIRLPENINTQHIDYTPFISTDESFLLFASSRECDEKTETEIFISHRRGENRWSDPQKLGEAINNGYTVTFPTISKDGRFLFFNRFVEAGTDTFYWVDSAVLKPYL
jgi:Tol biopolymer transport system component